MPRVAFATLLIAAVASSIFAAQPTFVDVAPGVVAALQPHDGRFDDANVTILIGEQSVMLVDAPTSVEFLDAVIAEVKKRTELPVRYIVNTHWHADHTQGNGHLRKAFPQATTIGHDSLRASIPERAQKSHDERVANYTNMIPKAKENLAKGLGLSGQELSEEQQANQKQAIANAEQWLADNGSFKFEVPIASYSSRLDIDLGGMMVELRHVKAHTEGDTVVWIPQHKVLISGDMLDDLPYVGHGYPQSWSHALGDLATLGAAKTIPGHGPIFEGDGQRRTIHDFIDALLQPDTFDKDAWREKLAGKDAGAQRFFNGTIDEALGRQEAVSDDS